MLDQLRRDIKTRLDEVLVEADKLRRALAALSSRSGHTTPTATPVRSAPQPPATTPSSEPATQRAAPGATKSAILAALAGGGAMTAGEIAAATGLGRPTVSTTLSRLAKTGEVSKAARGYQVSK